MLTTLVNECHLAKSFLTKLPRHTDQTGEVTSSIHRLRQVTMTLLYIICCTFSILKLQWKRCVRTDEVWRSVCSNNQAQGWRLLHYSMCLSVWSLASPLKCVFCFSELRYRFLEEKLDFCNFWKVTNGLCAISFLHMRVGESCGGVFYSLRRGCGGFCGGERHIKKECGQYYFWNRVDVIAVLCVMGNHCVLGCSKWLLRANSVRCLI